MRYEGKTKMMTKSLIRTLKILLVAGSLLLPLLNATNGPLAADSYISSATPTQNFGTATTLSVASGNAALVQFDLAGIPAGTNISKAYLRLFVDKVTAGGTLNVAPVTSGWTEGGVTFAAQPTVGAVFASSPVNVQNAFIYIDVTSQAQGWLASPASNFGLEITGTGGINVLIDSKENQGTSHPAQLELAVVGTGGAIGATGPTGPTGP